METQPNSPQIDKVHEILPHPKEIQASNHLLTSQLDQILEELGETPDHQLLPRQIEMPVTVDFCKCVLAFVDSLESKHWAEAMMNCAFRLVDWVAQNSVQQRNRRLSPKASRIARRQPQSRPGRDGRYQMDHQGPTLGLNNDGQR
jgi:hypothetical protein